MDCELTILIYSLDRKKEFFAALKRLPRAPTGSSLEDAELLLLR